jgi:hypothetical protein
MSNWKWLLLILGTVLITAGGRTAPAQSVGAGVIQGNITSADGGPMEGVVVSARAPGKTFTTSVFTDRQGNYVFPSLDAGQYRLWAQAVGFDAARSEFALTGTGINRSLTMVPIKDVGRIVKQMSGVEFLRSCRRALLRTAAWYTRTRTTAPDATPRVTRSATGGMHVAGAFSSI